MGFCLYSYLLDTSKKYGTHKETVLFIKFIRSFISIIILMKVVEQSSEKTQVLGTKLNIIILTHPSNDEKYFHENRKFIILLRRDI